MLKSRIVDFPSLPARIGKLRAAREVPCFDIDLPAISNRSAHRDCFVCGLPLLDGDGPSADAAAICFGCSATYVTVGDYRRPLAQFRLRVEASNRHAALLAAEIGARRAVDGAMLAGLVKALPLSEVEFYLGRPARLGGFDHGLESGRWRLGAAEFELWFEHRVCIGVDPI